jgi:hypothetical protein
LLSSSSPFSRSSRRRRARCAANLHGIERALVDEPLALTWRLFVWDCWPCLILALPQP